MLNLTPLPAFNDNYIWLLQNPESKGCAVVDPGDARPVLQWLQDNADWQLSDILVTHHHSDHTGGIEQIKQATGARVIAPASEDISHSDLSAVDGQSVRVLGHELQVMHVPGHTLGHVAYYHAGEPGFVLSGDTLFAAGCGRMFEGTPEQMAASLLRLAQLPPATLVYCAHETRVAGGSWARRSSEAAICSGVPSNMRPQPAANRVSPLSTKPGSPAW